MSAPAQRSEAELSGFTTGCPRTAGEGKAAFGGVGTRGRKHQPLHQHMMRIEADVHVLHGEEAAHHQSGTGQQHDRERHLRYHQARTQPARSLANCRFQLMEQLSTFTLQLSALSLQQPMLVLIT